MNHRAPWHDYKIPAIYHITIMKSIASPVFSTLYMGNDNKISVSYTSIGFAIYNALKMLRELHPALSLLQYVIMPDHVHLLIRVEREMNEIIGAKLAKFKVMVNKLSNHPQVFGKGFHDHIITPKINLDTIYRYIRENPYRLIVRRQYPDFFRRINSVIIAGEECQAYGNLHLLENPFKEAIIIHRSDDAQTLKQKREEWLYNAVNGGVLVSPFISKAEKAIRTEAEQLGAKVILLSNKRLSEREKPSAHDFAQCAKGKLLIIYPNNLPIEHTLSRTTCLSLNALAERISM